jgi:hypothetical protein
LPRAESAGGRQSAGSRAQHRDSRMPADQR